LARLKFDEIIKARQDARIFINLKFYRSNFASLWAFWRLEF